MRLETSRKAVRIGNALLRCNNHFFARLWADMREVAQYAHAIHLGDDLAPEVRKATVATLVAASPDKVLGVVGNLHDANTQLLEEPKISDLVLDSREVLPAKNDPGPAGSLRVGDVVGRVDLRDQVVVLTKPVLPAHHVSHRLGEPFPDAARAVRGGQAAAAHILENGAAKIGDEEAVDNNRFLMQFGCHCVGPLIASGDFVLSILLAPSRKSVDCLRS